MRYLLLLALLGCADAAGPVAPQPSHLIWEYVPPHPQRCYWVNYDGFTWVRVCEQPN